ncbi:MAG TPA: zinc ribbon domain-containing protein [Solirubrobacteraceae bacterium]|nr:zinc ribbon domain-containing protein [Solirubrobacteraceae bacterium]
MTVTGPDPGRPAPESTSTQAFEPLISAAASDRCGQCGAELAPDQRYCVECGTRRGRARFTLPSRTPAPAPVLAPRRAAFGPPPEPGVPMISSSAALLATIAVLLLAMGVGVLIGNSGHSANASKVTVIGGAGAGTSAGTAATGGTGAGAATSGLSGSGGGATKVHRSAHATSAKTPVSASNTLHPTTVNPTTLHTKTQRKKALTQTIHKTVPLKNGKHLAPETQALGGSCTAGTVGCVNGKYTGQFF